MRNLVLVCLDTVRKDFFDSHAPRLRERADVVYDECRAASSWSAPSHASMFTGQLPHEHGVHAYHRDFAGLTRADTFLGDLSDYRALGASANVWAGSSFGFDGLFDSFSDVSPDQRFPEGMDVARFGQECEATGVARQVAFLRAALAHDRPLRSVANGALVQVDRAFQKLPVPKPLDDGANLLTRETLRQVDAGDEPFFGFVNFMDAHGPVHHVRGYDRSLHDAPLSWTARTVNLGEVVADRDEETMAWYRGVYGAAIDYLDRKVCAFADALQARTDRKTTVEVTADHGNDLALTDEYHWGHTESRLTEGLLHVPLVVLNAPGSGRDVHDEYVSHLRLPELLLGLGRGERPGVTEPRIRAERIGFSGSRTALTEDDSLSPFHDRTLRAVYGGTTKTVWDHEGGAWRHELDPQRPCWEPAGTPVDDAGGLDALFSVDIGTVAREVRESDGGPDVDAATESRLRDLGYL